MTQREADERIAKLLDRRDKAYGAFLIHHKERSRLEREIDAINEEIARISEGQLEFETSFDPINQHKHEVSDERIREGPEADGVGRRDHQLGK